MSKNCLYVGGLDDSVDLETLYTIFGSFGEITSIYFPISTDTALTTESQQQRNFAFVEFENNLDARSAIDNMHLSEINGRIIKCNWAHTTTTTNKESYRNPDDFEQNKPIWEQDTLYQQQQ